MMTNYARIIKTFNVEENPALVNLVLIIKKNNISNFNSFKSWKKYFSRYIDPKVINRNKDIAEFEHKLKADLFEIIFSIHLIVYLFGKRIIRDIDIPRKLKTNLYENVFEESINLFSNHSQKLLQNKIDILFNSIISSETISDIYSLLENIYRVICPKEIRKPLGEYFTPLPLAEKMVSQVDSTLFDKLWMDNSSGFGVFLYAYAKKFGIDAVKNFVCIEVNPLSVFISKVVIISEFRDKIAKMPRLNIFWGDALLNEQYKYKNGKIIVAGNFAKYFGKIAVIIGNPPWVSWKSMTKEYQSLIGDDWRSYDIFEKNITRKTMGACNDDISSYFVYYSIDKFLARNGLIKFVINLSLFKSNLVGKQFRQFYIKKSNTYFKLSRIYDLSSYKVFKGITNTYCVFDAIKSKKTVYPVPYTIFISKTKNKLEIIETTARPVNNTKNEALITVNGNEENFQAIEGICDYKARAGVCTWLNSVYWIKTLDEGELATITNLGQSGKKKLKEVKIKVEKNLIFKLLRARNLRDFNPLIENHIIIPQIPTKLSKPIPEDEMQKSYPLTYRFFINFREELLGRSGYKKFLLGQPFYSLYNIGPYTTAPIKLGWQFVSKKFRVFIIDNATNIIPDLNVMFIPLTDIEEAYYLHALLNSKYARAKIESSSNWTFPGGSIQKIYLEKFDASNELHTKISLLQNKFLHNSAYKYEETIDNYYREYWFNGKEKNIN